MKRIISMLVALCLLASCGTAAAEEKLSLGSPYTNPNLFSTFPERPGPEENYYIWANYDALVRGSADARSVFNDDRSRGYWYLAEQALEICRNPEYTDTDSQIVRVVYSLAEDQERRERDGFAALTERADRLKAVQSTEELTALLQEEGFLISTPFLFTQPKAWGKDQSLFMVTVAKGPVLQYLPMENDYAEPVLDKDTPRERLIRMQYSEEEARRLVDEIERYNNDLPVDNDESQMSLLEIRESCPPLYAILSGVGLVPEGAETKPVYVLSTGELALFKAWYTDENLELLKAIVLLRLYDDTVKILNSDSFIAQTGNEDILLFQVIDHVVGIPMDQAYITHFCPPERWVMATKLFEETREAMRARILANPRLSEESKTKAMEKLNDLTLSQIVPPGGSFDSSLLLEALRECRSLTDAVALCRRFNNLCLMRYAGERVTKDNPYTAGNGVLNIGGAYLPEHNMFFIGAPGLNGSFCDATSRETLLATLGMHIGHELSHGYDTYGAMRDVTGTGTLFTDEDMAAFRERASSIATQLDKIETGNGFHVMGDQVIYENLADMTGMCLMLDLAKKDENFDYDAFFRAYAVFSLYYEYGNDYHPDNAGRVDPHPPSYVRVNFCVAHFDEFYQTYPSVTEGTPMYIAPEDRILVW